MTDDEDDDDQGAFRWDDPDTSKKAARSIKVGRIMRLILRYIEPQREPRNGWEMSKALDLPTITVVPRLAPMRRNGLIKVMGTRPGPSNRGQVAYVITEMGKRVLNGRNTP
jgi:hypothetical protein